MKFVNIYHFKFNYACIVVVDLFINLRHYSQWNLRLYSLPTDARAKRPLLCLVFW